MSSLVPTRAFTASTPSIGVVVALLVVAALSLLTVRVLSRHRTRHPIKVVPVHRQPLSRAAVVINPTKVGDPEAYRRRIRATMAAAGWDEPRWLVTTAEDHGWGPAVEAVRGGAEVVFVCGGDGTVRACAGGLVGSGVPLALLPSGTGNLLARNLKLPMDLDEALWVGLHGVDRTIDVGMVGDQLFTVMAGIGFDAAIMADAPEKLKKQVGWVAYVVSGMRHLRDRRMQVTLRLDGGPPLHRRARMVLVGNVGALQAGVQLLPDAKPDDGVLDVVVLAPRGVVDWLRVGSRIMRRRTGVDWRIEHFQGRSIEIEADRNEPRELDGDLIEDGTSLIVQVEPEALLVRVPR